MFKVDSNRINPLHMVPDITDHDLDAESLDPIRSMKRAGIRIWNCQFIKIWIWDRLFQQNSKSIFPTKCSSIGSSGYGIRKWK